MKKWALCVGMVLVLGLAVSAMAADVLVGACIYKFDDTFMTGVRNAMNAEMKEHSGSLEIVDSQNRQPDQNNQVDTLYFTSELCYIILNIHIACASDVFIQFLIVNLLKICTFAKLKILNKTIW